MTFSRIKPNNWQTNERVTQEEFNQLDLDHSKALDKTGDNIGNGGGISGEVDVLGGGSLQFESGSNLFMASGVNAWLDGYTTTGATGEFVSGNPGSIVLGGSATDYPSFPARSRAYLRNCSELFVVSAVTNPVVSANEILSHTSEFSSNFYCSLPPHQGATLSSVTVLFSTANTWSQLPSAFPELQVFQFSTAAGNTASTYNGMWSSGAAVYPSETLATWNNNHIKTLTVTNNQYNVIDTTTYTYLVQIAPSVAAVGGDENLLEQWYTLQFHYTNITNMQFPG